MQGKEENEEIVNNQLIHIVDNDRNIKTIFNKKAYEGEFLDFYRSYTQSLTAYQSLYELHSQPEAYAREVAMKIMDHEMKKINGISKKSRREMQMMEDSAFTALFVVPAMGYFQTSATDCLADCLVEEWRKNFPKNQIQRGDFNKINAGFKEKRGLLDLLRGGFQR